MAIQVGREAFRDGFSGIGDAYRSAKKDVGRFVDWASSKETADRTVARIERTRDRFDGARASLERVIDSVTKKKR